MKTKLSLLLICVITTIHSIAAVTIRYYNKDSKPYKLKATINGNIKEVVFDASKTSSVTVQGTGSVCTLETTCGKIEIKDGQKIEIKDGCIKIIN